MKDGNEGVTHADFRFLAPDPKPKKNRELKTEILPVSTPQVNTPSVGTPTGEMANLALGKGGKEKRPKSPAKAG